MPEETLQEKRWTPERAQEWYALQPWLCGFNYVPSYAVNSTEMWQKATFDPETIARELGWARDIGFNTCRVFIPYLVWEDEPEALLSRINHFLGIAAGRCGIATMPVFFDDCAFAGKEPYLGPQDESIPGVHNSGWTPSPGYLRVNDAAAWPGLREYVHSLMDRFGHDGRVLAWDLYNEPGNNAGNADTLPLLKETFRWAREVPVSQPLTCGVWMADKAETNAVCISESDVLSFHDYNDLGKTRAWVEQLRQENRPILCTEWMRRGFDCGFDTHLTYFKKERIGCWFWGLVNGRMQTHFPWGSPKGVPEPPLWFHDLLDRNGNPYNPDEISCIRGTIEEV